MMSALDKTPEMIRQNWNEHKEIIKCGTVEYKLLWSDLEKKFNIDTKDIIFQLLKRFVSCEIKHNDQKQMKQITYEKKNDNTLMIKGLNGEQRRKQHMLCDNIGLHHTSKPSPNGKFKNFLYVYIPDNWLWEYSDKNPYSENNEYYKQKDIEREKRQSKMNERMKKIYCCMCEKNALETELFHSVYIDGKYCEECLDTSDGDGGTLNDHKFEHIRFRR
jgi:hypothetical protein